MEVNVKKGGKHKTLKKYKCKPKTNKKKRYQCAKRTNISHKL